MSLSLKLEQSLKQQLTLSPQLIQTFEVLAMSTLELQQKIRDEIESNPALEIPPERSLSIERIAESQNRVKAEDDLSDSAEYDPNRYYSSVRLSSYFDQSAADQNQQFIEGALSRDETLQSYLKRQLGWLKVSEEEVELGSLIISNLDSNGFHRNKVESLVKPNQIKKIKEALKIVQSLDPPGIGVYDFKESLVLQAKIDGLSGKDLDLFTEMVYSHLEKLRLNKFKEVATSLQLEENEVELLYRYLKTLNPYPGKLYDTRETQYIIPDLYVRQVEGKLQLTLNDDAAPTLSIDTNFQHLGDLSREETKKEVSSYITNAVRSANQLISQIEMRGETIRNIGLQLIKHQSEFFLSGPRYLKPLTYRVLAEELSLHETTISRAVQGKYIDTDWGILPIKELFSSSLQTTTGEKEEVSKTAVKEMVKEIILEHEGPKKLSDQKIANILASKGIKIARRTVTKYRNELNIDSSYERLN